MPTQTQPQLLVRGTSTSQLDWSGDALALGLFTDTELTGDLAALDTKLSGTIAELIEETQFEGKPGKSACARIGGGSTVRKIILIGLGDRDALTLDTLRRAAAACARIATNQHCQTLGLALPIADYDPAIVAQIATEGAILGLHEDKRFKSDPEENARGRKLETIDLLGVGDRDNAIAKGEAIAAGTILARELVNGPANTVTPLTMAETAEQLAAEYGLTLEILEKADCERLGMGAFLGVAQASDLPPKLVHMTYKPAGMPRRKVAIVGKGLTFDSGGLNIKSASSGIETMKMDMGGAAATYGAAQAIAQLKPDVEVHFISAVTENMIGGRAMHPGDILTASNGKTIEVNNTDAEGRLTLADALVFAEKLEVDAIVDLATLTGACMVALGKEIGGLWSTDETIATELKNAAEAAGEKFWQMPLEDKYFDGMKSDIADMKNTGPRPGGAITAALFLKQYIENTPWAHLDIAGPVWADKESGVNNSGATGFPVRTLVNWVLA
ncbi:leucyl aminopeptidase [Rubidibacter lacunae KORDI 51-2]|uniref:Probable cytosol aminopeptidase n=1 Tax=Rubidibacter lacunae KORDI 51-2 TaxID=582515 RepID=U5DPR6_9CHRO|nr:leucyl aminopeptidase [Rubidibacter lacunae]ERN42862.1 leucyl aminopeptidase [Rubidibacter lacunae KORDI 51-2]